MNKILSSILILVFVVIGGYFIDDGYKAKVDKLLGKSTTTVNPSNKPDNTHAVNSELRSSSTFSHILDTGTINVSVQNPSNPFYSTTSGSAQGFNVDFMKLMLSQPEFKGKRILIKPYEVSTYENVPKQLLSNKNIDIAIDGLTFNDEDLPGVIYTVPYVKDFGYSLITARGNSITNIRDLEGSKIGVLKGDPDVHAFVEQTFPGSDIVELSDRPDSNGKWLVGHIKSGRVAAIVYDYPFAVSEIEGTDLQFSMAKIKGSDIQYRIGVREAETELLTALNSAIKRTVETDMYSELIKKYFMSDKVTAARRAASGEITYVVAKGDTLSTIAQTHLGDKMKYSDIQVRNNLANPNFIAVGQRLVIPK